jgi:hypothetical protein
MKRIVKYFNWELKNEFLACSYFTVMILLYGILKWILGDTNIKIYIIIEMFLTNYAISTIQRIFFDDDKAYSEKEFHIRAVSLSIICLLITILCSILGGWFHGMPIWSGPFVYAMLVISYLTVWYILKLAKRYDTQELNKQLETFKRSKQ